VLQPAKVATAKSVRIVFIGRLRRFLNTSEAQSVHWDEHPHLWISKHPTIGSVHFFVDNYREVFIFAKQTVYKNYLF
jgi:hypothetical protein